MADVKAFFDGFYKHKDITRQDAFILKNCTAKKTERRRPKNNNHKPKTYQINYFMYSISQKKAFTSMSNIFLKSIRYK